MKKLFFLFALVGLFSCTPRVALPPEQVLEKVSVEQQHLQAARFEADVSYNAALTLHASGILLNGGNQAIADIKMTHGPLNFIGRFLMASQSEKYLLVSETNIPTLRSAIGPWWSLNTPPGTDATSIPLSPDPVLIRKQMSVIRVTQDRGFETIDGHSVYHYEVEIDRQKMIGFLDEVARQSGQNQRVAEAIPDSLKFQGECWIDAKSFLLRKIQWDITSTDVQKPLHIQLAVSLQDQNSAIAIEPPKDAKPFPIEMSAATDILRSIYP